MKTLLRNGKIYDGNGADAFTGDLLIEDDRIAGVYNAADGAAVEADRIIDLNGRSVAPGFIDCHSHNDWFAIKEEPLPCFEPFIRQGITSFITGNCGLSAIGFEADTPNVDKIGGGLFSYKGCKGVYPDAASFLDAVDCAVPCNIATLTGHCSARAGISGYENRDLSEEEMQRMLACLERDLQEGAAGVSLGLMYEPGCYSKTEELRKVAELCVKYDKPLTVHPRAESKVSMAYPQLFGRSHLLRAFDELVEISKGTNLKLQYSHAIFVGRQSFADKPEFLRIVEELRKDGVRVQFDIYDELKGVSVITVVLPDWYRGMSQEERNKPLNRLKLRLLITATSMLLGFGFDDIEIAYIGPGCEKYEGKTVHQLAVEYGKSDLDMYLQLCRESDFQGRVNMGPYTTPEIIRDFEHNPLCLYMTDAWLEEHGVQNPTLYECFPRFLQDSVKGIGDTLPATISRMTGATAERFMLKDRGFLRPGCFADITVFDEEELRTAVPDEKHAFGINKVFVNGKLLLDEGVIDAAVAASCGQAIRV